MKPTQLHAKTILITGASSGIGEQLAEQVARLGGRPILVARSGDKLARIAQRIFNETNQKVPIFSLDVSKKNDVERVLQTITNKHGPIDILVNNAGFGKFEYAHKTPLEDYEQIIRVNYLGTVYCTLQLLPHMRQQKKGHIMNVISMAGKIAVPKTAAYAASKHALIGFTNSLRMELADTNIHVTAINPGPVSTPFLDIADQSGQYRKNMGSMMLTTDQVVRKIIRTMLKPRREVNMPFWMNAGSHLLRLFPSTERIARRIMDRK